MSILNSLFGTLLLSGRDGRVLIERIILGFVSLTEERGKDDMDWQLSVNLVCYVPVSLHVSEHHRSDSYR